ncbi:MAG: hypothetical protein CSA35_07965 [Dethiosulfovibrio peptidovorans]|nr:MAG: hypothetical protein CSA35_07965 [Dethiosulfovibrio peptidovorans]
MVFIVDVLKKYWGKADGFSWHSLVAHSLDVAMVGKRWLELSSSMSRCVLCGSQEAVEWILYFLYLHDLGKADLRFQLKRKDLMNHIWSYDEMIGVEKVVQDGPYSHGAAGLRLFDNDRKMGDFADSLHSWMKAVCAHHGAMPEERVRVARYGTPEWEERDCCARSQMITLGKDLFLDGISSDFPPEKEPPDTLYGFCSVCDWIGSNSLWFPHDHDNLDEPSVGGIENYMGDRLNRAEYALRECGLISMKSGIHGMAGLYHDWTPRGIQTFQVSPPEASAPLLAVMEAPTGSGKTEAALSLASQWLAEDRADSIIFALPTQATANAMFDRLQRVATRLFPESPNVILAHGRSRFNRGFQGLVDRGANRRSSDDGLAQCSRWLASGKKKALLGQVGICTLDQVLLSVLPVRHGFVRSLGIARSVLIVDEVHAYDSYMNGLMDEVLSAQRKAGGCVILLSATLQSQRLQSLIRLWNGGDVHFSASAPYPLVTFAQSTSTYYLEPDDRPPKKTVRVETVSSADALPDQAILERICQEAKGGKVVAVICNVVDHAQKIWGQIKRMVPESVLLDIFHARYAFEDRASIESHVMRRYGPEREAAQGAILVATQVVEQSLDLDFDLMITQLSPVDLLFQRIGRLHRHEKLHQGDELPSVIVLAPEGDEFGLHGVVYKNDALLWRTRALLQNVSSITFPDAYRTWIEAVYGDGLSGEPKDITREHEEWQLDQEGRSLAAHGIAQSAVDLSDTDPRVALMTRDGEMAVTVLPYDGKTDTLLDKERTPLASVAENPSSFEVVHLQTISVPSGWGKLLNGLKKEEGIFFLPVVYGEEGWSVDSPMSLRYTAEAGLERV